MFGIKVKVVGSNFIDKDEFAYVTSLNRENGSKTVQIAVFDDECNLLVSWVKPKTLHHAEVTIVPNSVVNSSDTLFEFVDSMNMARLLAAELDEAINKAKSKKKRGKK